MQSDYVISAVKGVKESFDNAADASIMQYKDARLFTFEETTEWNEIFNSTEGLSVVKELSETETPPVGSLAEGYQITLYPKRYGGAIEVTETDMERFKDSTTLIDKYIAKQRDQILVDGKNYFLETIFGLYNDAFAGATYLAPDGIALCGTHVYASTGTTFSNSATKAMSQSAIEDLEEYGGAFQDADGRPMPVTFDTIVVKKGSAAAREAKKLFGMYGMKPTAISDINLYEGEYTLIETPYITSANNTFWFALASQKSNPLYVGIHKMPSLNSPIVQNNEAVRSNSTFYFKVGINNLPVFFYGSNGTT